MAKRKPGRPKKSPEERSIRMHLSFPKDKILEKLMINSSKLGITPQTYLKATLELVPLPAVRKLVRQREH